ncbi:GDP/UDP-N,N'-diacetylbacillosamine 2-epimerase (hydrolyzing) [Ferrovum sp. JA12]|uniref:UDP-N-acetylglucosamine 2-epimerase n=1 Tax=Ferrovum sp. JA12 TaxID=1356299 RepID=UPI000703299A|nr:UDP-N-acetylglucosamine 2-epimerase [Ferrovum sp. JA12]KRH78205.1 GDP/UDP-N,N'-diacetylbacillosamine 2-epimerase (hydrolyzing) [Ferrovum sp. JA12]HQT81317.1 UDP-N-acetylglucosamine 2-epimerase [Ferrovaceae bacterium]HQU05770.1 UDP-N-acetylglucosamine 2-epimerase [Ferrovaceae bacterium]
MNKKICVAITARPSYSRIRSALEKLRDNHRIDLSVICSGSALLPRYGRIVDYIKHDGFNVTDELYTFVEGDEPINMALTTANTMSMTAQVFKRIAPDFVITIADRYETLGTAVAASYMNIPLIHIQGGEISGNIDEVVRHAVTKLSDYHLVSNEYAAHRVHTLGEPVENIFITGCPSIVIAEESKHLSEEYLINSIKEHLDLEVFNINDPFIVLLLHSETLHYEDSFNNMLLLLRIVEKLEINVLIFSPNLDSGSDAIWAAIDSFKKTYQKKHFFYINNLEGHVFLKLLSLSLCLIGNSSVGIRECAFLGIPVVNIGERQMGRERANNVIDVAWDEYEITAALIQQLTIKKYSPSSLYGHAEAGQLIANVIADLALSDN